MTEHTMNPLAAEVSRCIEKALEANAAQECSRITVSVDGDCVVLEGTVRSWAEHEDIERAARSAPNVKSVDNRLSLLIKAKPSPG